MGRAQRIGQRQQRIARAEHRLVLEDIDRGRAGTAGLERLDQGAGLDQLGPAGVDEERTGLHAGQIRPGDAGAGLRRQPQMNREHIGLRVKLIGLAATSKPLRQASARPRSRDQTSTRMPKARP